MINFKNGTFHFCYLQRIYSFIFFRQKSMFNSYQNQAALFNRLKNEMIGLYAKVNISSFIFMN